MFVDHYFAECVLVGGARRAARMSTKSWRDKNVLSYIIAIPTSSTAFSPRAILRDSQGTVDCVMGICAITRQVSKGRTRKICQIEHWPNPVLSKSFTGKRQRNDECYWRRSPLPAASGVGSSVKNLRPIIAQGLIPEVKEKNWQEHEETSHMLPRASPTAESTSPVT
jgi:hypothetical protein